MRGADSQLERARGCSAERTKLAANSLRVSREPAKEARLCGQGTSPDARPKPRPQPPSAAPSRTQLQRLQRGEGTGGGPCLGHAARERVALQVQHPQLLHSGQIAGKGALQAAAA
jgi:hypothetical protein